MNKLTVAALCAVLVGSAMAEDEPSLAEQTVPPKEEMQQAPAASAVPPATPEAVPAAQAPAASAVAPATPQAAPAAQAPEAAPTQPKSSIPLEKRRGGDITECLEAGSKSDKDVAACADKYRPRSKR